MTQYLLGKTKKMTIEEYIRAIDSGMEKEGKKRISKDEFKALKEVVKGEEKVCKDEIEEIVV